MNAASNDPSPRAPPGLWRVLGPALVTWAAVAGAIAFPGSWWMLVVASLVFGVVLAVVAVVAQRGPSLAHSVGPSAPAHISGALLAYGAVLAALLLVTGARLGIEEAQRASPQLDAAVATGTSVNLRVRLSDFPSLQSRSEMGLPKTNGQRPRPGLRLPSGLEDGAEQVSGWVSGWVPGNVQGVAQSSPVVLWLQETPVGAATAQESTGPAPNQVPVPAQTLVPERWAPGTELVVTGTLVELEPTSSAAYGIRVETLTPIAPAPPAAVVAAGLRAELRARAEPVPGAELVPGFAVGDTALVGDELDEQMKASSLTHLVAVSGANCALVTSAAIWALSWCGCGRRVRAIAAGLSLGAFVFVVGPDVSVQRAAIMGAVLLVSSYGGKRAVGLPALGIAIVVLLIADPWQAWHPGFALSVVATGGIMLCAPAFTEALRRVAGIPRWIALPVAVAAAAQLACGPLLLLLQDGLPAAGLIANVLAGPAAPAGTALGLAALVAGPVSGSAAEAFVVAASLPARWVEATARVASELPGARWDWLTGAPGALLLAGVEAAAITAWLLAIGRITRQGARVTRPWEGTRPGPRALRVWVAVLLGGAVGVFLGPTVVAPTVLLAGVPNDWRIVACDVGQGDAILVRGSTAAGGEAVLVDTGDDETQLRACLRLFGINRITLLVLTHDHLDHIGAVGAVIPMAQAALVAPNISGAIGQRPLLAQLEAGDVPWRIGGTGDTGLDAGMAWEVLAPDHARTPPDPNASSLVMRVDLGDLTGLLLGDTGEPEQGEMLAALTQRGVPDLLNVDVVKVAHHGSRDQHSRMYEAAAARVGLVSSGSGNGYGHPARDTLNALVQAGTSSARTDESGSVAVSPGAHGPRVWAERASTANDVSGEQ